VDALALVDAYEPGPLARDPFPRVSAKIEAALESGDDEAVNAAVAAIDLLDRLDGDPDLEPCLAGDDGCHYFDCGRREGWGSEWSDDGGECASYGDDQSEGPINSVGLPWSGYETHAWRS